MSKFVKLSSIAELTVGFVGTMAKHYEDEGIPFLRSLNIKPFKIISDDMKYVSAEFSNSLSKSILHKGDVVIVRTGIPGTCCVVPAEYDGCNCSDVVIVHPNTELVNPHYLAAYINFWGQRQIQNNKVGAYSAPPSLTAAPNWYLHGCWRRTPMCRTGFALLRRNSISPTITGITMSRISLWRPMIRFISWR